jgi:hypothetical protein
MKWAVCLERPTQARLPFNCPGAQAVGFREIPVATWIVFNEGKIGLVFDKKRLVKKACMPDLLSITDK